MFGSLSSTEKKILKNTWKDSSTTLSYHPHLYMRKRGENLEGGGQQKMKGKQAERLSELKLRQNIDFQEVENGMSASSLELRVWKFG